jgi:hypothetical protein
MLRYLKGAASRASTVYPSVDDHLLQMLWARVLGPGSPPLLEYVGRLSDPQVGHHTSTWWTKCRIGRMVVAKANGPTGAFVDRFVRDRHPREENSLHMSEVQGEYDDRFSPLRDLFQENLDAEKTWVPR